MSKGAPKTTGIEPLVKWFIKHYEISTRGDIDRIIARIDQFEKMLKSSAISVRGRRGAPPGPRRGSNTATGIVLEVVKNARKGVGINEIQNATGYDEKKLRNIIFRLNKLGKIKREGRGVYIAI